LPRAGAPGKTPVRLPQCVAQEDIAISELSRKGQRPDHGCCGKYPNGRVAGYAIREGIRAIQGESHGRDSGSPCALRPRSFHPHCSACRHTCLPRSRFAFEDVDSILFRLDGYRARRRQTRAFLQRAARMMLRSPLHRDRSHSSRFPRQRGRLAVADYLGDGREGNDLGRDHRSDPRRPAAHETERYSERQKKKQQP
jgi:hypothetical protein